MPNIIMILGSQNTENGILLPVAIARLNKGLEVFKQHPNYKILLTGGFGSHFNTTVISHGEYARAYLLSQGINQDAITPEVVLSANTVEDARKALPILEHYQSKKIIVVSSTFHIPRVEFIFTRILSQFALEFIGAVTLLSEQELQHKIEHEEKQLAALKRNGIY